MNRRERYITSDIALDLPGIDTLGVSGVKYESRIFGKSGNMKKETVTVQNEVGSELIGRDIGTYITFSFGNVWLCGDDDKTHIIRELTRSLLFLIDKLNARAGSVLVCCLGNRAITSDSLGPLVFDKLIITRHLTEEIKLLSSLHHREVAAICPGVVAQTGIETTELIKSAVNIIKPSVVLAIDSLACRSVNRLTSTLQLSDTGISPGSGIGNIRRGITKENVGAPVISVGAPTVVNSSTLVLDAIDSSGVKLSSESERALDSVLKTGQSFFVSPKECDTAVSELALLISNAVNTALSLQ